MLSLFLLVKFIFVSWLNVTCYFTLTRYCILENMTWLRLESKAQIRLKTRISYKINLKLKGVV